MTGELPEWLVALQRQLQVGQVWRAPWGDGSRGPPWEPQATHVRLRVARVDWEARVVHWQLWVLGRWQFGREEALDDLPQELELEEGEAP